MPSASACQGKRSSALGAVSPCRAESASADGQGCAGMGARAWLDARAWPDARAWLDARHGCACTHPGRAAQARGGSGPKGSRARQLRERGAGAVSEQLGREQRQRLCGAVDAEAGERGRDRRLGLRGGDGERVRHGARDRRERRAVHNPRRRVAAQPVRACQRSRAAARLRGRMVTRQPGRHRGHHGRLRVAFVWSADLRLQRAPCRASRGRGRPLLRMRAVAGRARADMRPTPRQTPSSRSRANRSGWVRGGSSAAAPPPCETTCTHCAEHGARSGASQERRQWRVRLEGCARQWRGSTPCAHYSARPTRSHVVFSPMSSATSSRLCWW